MSPNRSARDPVVISPLLQTVAVRVSEVRSRKTPNFARMAAFYSLRAWTAAWPLLFCTLSSTRLHLFSFTATRTVNTTIEPLLRSHAGSSSMNSRTAAAPVKEEQDGSAIFGTLFDLPPVHRPAPTLAPTPAPLPEPPLLARPSLTPSPVLPEPTPHENAGPPHKECTVCLDTLSKSLFPESLHADQHSSDVCSKCFDEHVESELDDKSYEHIGCPQCTQTLTEPEIRKLGSVETYKKYDRPTFCETRLGC
jgi:hypothetical protein